MESSNPPMNPSSGALPLVSRRLLGLSVIALGLGVAWLTFRFELAAGGADSSGYLNSGRLFAAGKLEAELRVPVELGADVRFNEWVPLGFWTSLRPGMAAPTYPPGLPLQFAAASLVLGWNVGPWLVMFVLAAAAPILCLQCAREMGLSPWLGFAAAVILVLSPVTLFCASQPLSDLPATTWCLAAVWTALRAHRLQANSWAVASGLCLALAVLVRPSNVLLLPALVVVLGGWRRWLAAGLGGLPGAIGLAYYNQTLYGHPLRNGYGDIVSSLEAIWVWPTLSLYGEWIPRLLPAVVLLLPLVALAGGLSRLRLLVALGLWGAAFAIFYAFYPVTHEVWWCLRFVLPGFPALLLAAMLGVEVGILRLRLRSPEAARVAVSIGLATWSLVLALYWVPRLNLGGIGPAERVYRESGVWVNENLPRQSVVSSMAASGTLYYYSSLVTLRFDEMSPETYAKKARVLRAAERPIYALLFESERATALRVHGTDRWERIRDFGNLTLWRLSATP